MDGDRRLAIRGRRQLALLTFLLLRANTTVSGDELTDAISGPSRTRADNRLPMAIARLRRALEPLNRDREPRLPTVSGGYKLLIASGELDAEVFASQVKSAGRALEDRDAAPRGRAARARARIVARPGVGRARV